MVSTPPTKYTALFSLERESNLRNAHSSHSSANEDYQRFPPCRVSLESHESLCACSPGCQRLASSALIGPTPHTFVKKSNSCRFPTRSLASAVSYASYEAGYTSSQRGAASHT